MKVIKQIVKCRYIIGIVLIFIGVALNLNGSSTAIWDNHGVSVTPNGQQVDTNKKGLKIGSWNLTPSNGDGIVFGTAREVRSDAWLVQTPFFLAQSEAGLPLINKNYGVDGQNMVVAYNAPVKQISILGKPFNWGFLFLNGERAVSFYWCFKIVFMILLAFEVCMILTKKNLPLSIAGSFWITFTPLVQWWFMQHLGDLVFFTLAAVVAIHHFFSSRNKLAKLGFTLLLASSAIGFIFVLYPGFQIPFGYFLFFYFAGKFVTALRNRAIKRYDWLLLALMLLVITVVLAITLKDSWLAISSVLNTVYPGKRLAVGGGFSLVYFTSILSDFLLPFVNLPKAVNPTNASELAGSMNYLFLILMTLPFTIKREKIKENALGIYLSLFSLFLIFYASVAGFSKVGQKLSLLSYVEPNRAFQAGITLGVFASIWYISYLLETRKQQNRTILYVGIAAQALFMIYCIFGTVFGSFGIKKMLVLLLFYLLTQVFIVRGKKRLFIAAMTITIILSGMTINPISRGLPGIYQKSLAAKIQQIVASDKEAEWISDGENYLYQYPEIFGAKMINGVRFYPDKKLWTLLDPTNENEKKWNRYAHVKVILSTDEQNKFITPAPDQRRLTLSLSELKTLQVQSVVSNRELTPFFKEKGLASEEIYGPDKDGNTIYKISSY
jgi:hypothetical protein